MLRLRDRSEGFSIVELLITLIIIGVAFGAFMMTFTTIQNINKKALDIANANSVAFAKMEEYENKAFASIPSTSPIGTLTEVEDFSSTLSSKLEKPRVGKVYVNTISGTLKQVVVTIEFGSGASIRRVQYANFIQVNGLGR
jgi:prepilin-type N-terminal cleavage/methylation domain-containing protein